MKWYAYPLALVAWLLIAIFLFIFTWNYIGDAANPEWSYYILGCAGVFLCVSYILSRIEMSWELDVFIQVILVLGPVLWYLNIREPYKPPVYVFLIDAGYTGEVHAEFAPPDSAETKVRSVADTLYFKFDGKGEILLNEDFRTVRESMNNRFYFKYPDGSRKLIRMIEKNSVPPNDSTLFVAWEDTLISTKGQINYMVWKLDRADKITGSK